MKRLGLVLAATCGICLIAAAVMAQEAQQAQQAEGGGPRLPLQFSVTLREDWTDNRDQVEHGKESTFDTYVVPRGEYKLQDPRTFLDIYYAPSLWYRSNPDPANRHVQVLQDAGLDASQWVVEKRVKLYAHDNIYYTDDPQVSQGGAVLNQDQSYFENIASGGVYWRFVPKMDMDVSVSDDVKRYKNSDVAQLYNYDAIGANVQVLREVTTTVGLKAVGRYTDYNGYGSFDGLNRDSDSIIGALGADVQVLPKIRVGILAGLVHENYSDSRLSSDNAPYGELTLRTMASPQVQIVSSLVHSMRNADAFPYASQEYTEWSGRVAWETPAKVTLGLTGDCRYSKYDSSSFDTSATTSVTVPAGSVHETTTSVQADVSVKIRDATLTFAQRFDDLSTEVNSPYRSSYTQNTSSLALTVAF